MTSLVCVSLYLIPDYISTLCKSFHINLFYHTCAKCLKEITGRIRNMPLLSSRISYIFNIKQYKYLPFNSKINGTEATQNSFRIYAAVHLGRKPNLSPWSIMIIVNKGWQHKLGSGLYIYTRSGYADPTVL